MKLGISFEILNMDENYIAVPVGDDSSQFRGVLQLNEEASEIIRLLKDDTTEEQIAEELLKEYDSTKEELLSVIHGFVEQLRSNGLIVE